MRSVIRGRCHCHKVKFEIVPPTDFCSHCHCESCRRIHGAGFVTWTSVPEAQLKINLGEDLLKEYYSSPQSVWISCSHCSSPLFQKTGNSPGKTYIAVSSLIDPLDRKPDSHVSFEERVDWITVNDGLSQYKEKSSDRIKGS